MEPRLPRALTGVESKPALIVPVFGTPHELAAMVEQAAAAGADVIEWRADLTDDWDSSADVLSDSPLPTIATVRSDREGGKFPGEGHNYAAAAMKLATMQFDVLDVEIKRSAAFQIVPIAHDHGIPVITSHHNFDATPRNEEIIETLEDMAVVGADLLKIAFHPAHADDTWRQMELTRGLGHRFGAPIISISMGLDAAWTRLAAAACGSVATFGTVGSESAPGQMDAVLVRTVLDALDR